MTTVSAGGEKVVMEIAPVTGDRGNTSYAAQLSKAGGRYVHTVLFKYSIISFLFRHLFLVRLENESGAYLFSDECKASQSTP